MFFEAVFLLFMDKKKSSSVETEELNDCLPYENSSKKSIYSR